jgi:hypothetical protein
MAGKLGRAFLHAASVALAAEPLQRTRMAGEDLEDLPLKALELAARTVSKLKPLKIRSVAELYGHQPNELAAAGLSLVELEDLAERAAMHGAAWPSKDEIRAMFDDAPTPRPRDVARPQTPSRARPRETSRLAPIVLPPDMVEAFSVPATAPVTLGDDDVACFDPYVDESNRNFRTPPPSAKHLRLLRRLMVLRSKSMSGAEREYVIGLVDISALPAAHGRDVGTFVIHIGHLLADVLDRMGIERHALSYAGCAVQIAIAVKHAPKARALAIEHAKWIGNGPPFLARMTPNLQAVANAGLMALAET